MNILLILLTSFQVFPQSLEVDVTLSPAGSFVGKTNDVKGQAILKGEAVQAENIIINLSSLKTGISLRDSHTQKHLDTKNHPEAKLLKAVGKNGKGKAKIQFRGKEKIVDGTYKLSSDKKTLTATFPLVLSEFDITGIKYMGVGVKDSVTVRVSVPVKASSAGADSAKSTPEPKAPIKAPAKPAP